jgi:glycosyltransferase involved in cell wall biosynthesis
MIAQRADVVIAGNNYLADWFSNYTRDVRIVPTAVDTDHFRPESGAKKSHGASFVIGWTGLAWNLRYLEAIEAPLKRFIDQFADVKLLIIAEEPPTFQMIPSARVRYLPWSVHVEADALRQMDVGLMPLPDNEWTRGKCSFKMLQYMASGVPVVVSPVGMNAAILAMSPVGLPATKAPEWYEALEYLYNNREKGYEFSQNGRAIVERHFSKKVISGQLAEIFRELC